MEEKIIARVFGNGKITIDKHVRDLMDIKDGDYVAAIIWKIDPQRPGKTH